MLGLSVHPGPFDDESETGENQSNVLPDQGIHLQLKTRTSLAII